MTADKTRRKGMRVYKLKAPLIVGRVYKGPTGSAPMRYLGPVDPSKPVICTATMLSNTSWESVDDR